MLPVKIAGMGHYVPSRVVTNAELEARCHLPEGWIAQHSGVLERCWAEDHETASYMAAQAAHQAIERAGLLPTDIDLIINASGTPEQAIPDGGALLQRALGLQASGIPAFSVHATCLSFLVAVQVAANLLQSGLYRRILIASAEVVSAGINFSEPESATLMGDAAAAVVLTLPEAGDPAQILAMRFETFSSGADYTAIYGGGSRRHPGNPLTRPEDNLFTMNGPRLLKMTLKKLPPFLEAMRPGLSSGLGSIQFLVPHQASKAGFEMLKRLGFPPEQTMLTLDRFGNNVAASIPLALSMAIEQNCIQRGDEVFLLSTGAGMSIGGIILIY